MSIEKTYKKFLELTKHDDFDAKKFNNFAVVHHSSAIEGSTLSLEETIMLLDENLTPKNKHINETLMSLDHFEALKHVIQLANDNEPLSELQVKKVAGLVLKNTRGITNTILGEVDPTKGDYKLSTNRAGASTFANHQKVPGLMRKLISDINQYRNNVSGIIEVNNLAFDIHFQLVTIHPFVDGNGRTSRLMMNYIQSLHKLPLSVVFKEDKQEYYQSLVETRESENINVFRKFMFDQLNKQLNLEINKISKSPKIKKSRGGGMSFLF